MREIIFFVIISVVILGCSNRSKKVKDQMVKNDYPAYIIKSFMDGCMEDKSNSDVTQTLICSCLIEKIQSKYTVEQFNELGKFQNGTKWEEYQQFLNIAAEECIKNISTQTK